MKSLALGMLILVASPALAIAGGDTRILTNTEHAEALAVQDDELWVATRGGVERYSIQSMERQAVFTTNDGLDENHVWQIEVTEEGEVLARTRSSECSFIGQGFLCSPAPTLPAPQPSLANRFEGARETARLSLGKRSIVATAGQGVWLVEEQTPRRITPENQICSNHMMAIAEWNGTWFGSFDDGLCVTQDGKTFRSPEVPFHMVNDLVVTPKGMYVAAGAGLFRSTDGQTFERVKFVSRRGVNGVAFDGKSIWATTPGAVFRVRVNGGPKSWAYWRPGGTRSLQSVAVGKSGVWLASEDKGLIHKTPKGWTTYDRAAGAATSWALSVAVSPEGTAYGATLRHGVMSVDRTGKIKALTNLPDTWILDVRTVGDDVYVGTQDGAARVDENGTVTPIRELPDPRVHAIHVGAKQSYFATESGVLATQS
jgi:hypothetical protein